MASALARIEAAALKRGWRLEWETAPWKVFNWRIRSLRVLDGSRVRAAASCTVPKDGTIAAASEQCAAMLLERAP